MEPVMLMSTGQISFDEAYMVGDLTPGHKQASIAYKTTITDKGVSRLTAPETTAVADD